MLFYVVDTTVSATVRAKVQKAVYQLTSDKNDKHTRALSKAHTTFYL